MMYTDFGAIAASDNMQLPGENGEGIVPVGKAGYATLTADWNLLDACHLNCSYCAHGKKTDNYILDKDRLGLMADRLLELPQYRYQINFCGCESTLHPFLPWVVRRLLASGKDIKIGIETAGRQGPDYFLALCPEYKTTPIGIRLVAHPASSDLKTLLVLAEVLQRNDFEVHVKVVNDILHKRETAYFREAFSRLGRILPFDFDLVAPADAFGVGSNAASPRSGKSSFCCHGVNYIRINPDGSFTGSSCSRAVRWTPVWQGSGNPLVAAAYFIRCDRECQLKGRMQLPEFATEEDAETFITELTARRAAHIGSSGSGLDFDTAAIVRRMERLQKPVSGVREGPLPIGAEPGLLEGRLNAIADILKHCVDSPSRTVYLHALKSLQTGDSGWLSKACGSSRGDENSGDPGGESKKLLSGTMSDLKRILPKLHCGHAPLSLSLSLSLTLESLLDVPLLLLEKGWRHGFRFSRLPGAEHLLEIQPATLSSQVHYAVPDTEAHDISIILHGDGSPDKVRKSVESILANCADDVQIIVSGVESGETAGELGQEYGTEIVLVPREHVEENNWLAAAASLAQGRYLAVVSQGQTFGSGSLEEDIVAIDEADADVGMYRSAEKVGGEPAERVTVADALANWLTDPAAYTTLDCFIFRKSFLVERGLGFATAGISGLVSFIFPALYGADTILRLGYLPYSRRGLDMGKRLVPSSSPIDDISGFVNFTNLFLEGEDEQEVRKLAVERAYASLRVDLLAQILRLDGEGKLAEHLDKDRLRQMGSCRELLGCLIRDYAALVCERGKLKPEIDPRWHDWRAWRPVEADTNWTPYGDAETASGTRPILSVIIPAHDTEDYIQACLDSVLAQSMTNFEVIVVDDASGDGTFDILKRYADRDKRIRLYRMNQNCRQGVCRNKAIQVAHGEYMVFVDSDDRVEPGFFAKGVAVLGRSEASLCLFSCQGKTLDGRVKFRRQMEDGLITGQHAFDLCIDFQHTLAPWGKMFRTDFVQASGCRFKEFVFYEDIFFIGDLLRKAAAVATSSFLSYSNISTLQSTIQSENYDYFRIHSGCVLFDYLRDQRPSLHKEGIFVSPVVIFNLETIQLPAWQAYLRATGELALTDDDYELLKDNAGFMAALLAGLARFSAGGKFPEGSISDKNGDTAHSNVPLPAAFPIISVIVPVYKQEALLGRCLDSILEQDFENFEILVVDDASPDNTWKICEKYRKLDSRIRIFRNNSNRGQGYSRNFALEQSVGEYIIYADSDDYLLPGFFTHAVRVMKADRELDLAHFAAVRDTDSVPIYKIGDAPHTVSGAEMLERYCRDQNTFYAVWANIFRRSFLVGNDIKFPGHFFEDNVFMTVVLRKAGRMYIDQVPVYVRTVTLHSDSTMNPIKCTPRHVQGYFAMCANVAALLNGSDGAVGRPDLAARRIGNLCQGFNDSILGYLASFAQKGFLPLAVADLDNLRRTPELLDAMLRHYARLYARERGLSGPVTAALPADDEPDETCFFNMLAEMALVCGRVPDQDCAGRIHVKSLFRDGVFQEKILKHVNHSQKLKNINLANLESMKALVMHDYFLELLLANYALLWQKIHGNKGDK